MRDDLAMTELILARVTQAEEEAALLQQGVADSLARDEFPHDTAEDLKKLVKEDKRSLAPKYTSFIRIRKSSMRCARQTA